MNGNYSNRSLIEIDRDFAELPPQIELNGTGLSLPEVVSVARQNVPVTFTPDPAIHERVQLCYQKMLEQVEQGVPIYGCNTGYGAQAALVLNSGTARERLEQSRLLSEGIAHLDVSVGPLFEKDVVRAAMLVRINMLLQGVSAVRLEDIDILRQMLNNGITPLVNQYGGLGASGDLAHNCRVVNAARQLKGSRVWDKQGNIRSAREALQEENIDPLVLEPKAGLGLVNGDNFSTGLAALLAVDTLQLLLLSSAVGALVIEVLKGTNRSFHPLLAEIRPHTGQREVAELYRDLLEGSQLAYQELDGHQKRAEGIKVQDGYSLRAISQYHGINFEKIKTSLEIITTNANSVSDNPLWVPPEYATSGEKPWQWVSGGNFLASYMVEVMDGLRKTMTQIVKLNDRHMARMVDRYENNGLPPNLSDREAVTQCAFKAVQIQSGMFDVYSSLLSMPVSTMFGIHEEGNQDITAHSLTSGILGLENLRLARYSTAQNMLAVAQAVDLRGGERNLSPCTRPLYNFIREKTDYVTKERPLHHEIEDLYASIQNGEVMQVLRESVFNH